MNETASPPSEPSSQRLSSTLHLLAYLSHLGEERDLIDAVVQAAAIWYDLDARAYKRDLHGRFVLDVWLPGADLSLAPRDFSPFAVVSGPEAIRISSIAEQEQLGWQGVHGDLVLLPIPVAGRPEPRWIIAITDWRDPQIDPCLLVLCQMLGSLLEHLAVNRVRDVQQRLLRWIVQSDESLARLTSLVLEELVAVMGAGPARLAVHATGGTQGATLASVGDWTDKALPSPQAGQSVVSPERVAVALEMGPDLVAVVDVRPAAGSEFSVIDGMLGEAGAMVIGVWLAGTLKAGIGAGSGTSEAPPGFEARIAEEVAVAKRYQLEAGLLVIDLVRDSDRADVRALKTLPIPEIVSRQLRASDLLGRLEGGQIGVFLGYTDAEGVTSIATRLRRQLAEVEHRAGLPHVSLGQAVFPSGGQSAKALVAQARADAARAGDERPQGHHTAT